MSQPGSFVGAFDLSSQAGVAAVLAAIRASQLSPADKNELRDLVFSYANGGGDASVRIALEQKLSAHAITPVVPQRGGVAAPALEFGSYRPTPNFKAPAAPATNTPAQSSPQIAVPVSTLPQTPVPIPIQPSVEATITAPIPSSVSVAPSTPSTPATVTSVVAPMSAVSPLAAVQASAPQPQPQPNSFSTGQPEAVYLERIRQIKTAVNSKVGNPVNLVDINNAVGREYMNALLEAMKKLGSGAVSEMEPAMQRLEAAFASVQVAIKEHEERQTVSSPAPIPEPIAVTSPRAAEPAPPSASPVPPPSRDIPASFPVVSESEGITIPSSAEDSPSVNERVPLREVPMPPRPNNAVPVLEEVGVPVVTSDEEGPSGFESVSTDTVVPPPPPSLATEKKLLTPNDLKNAADVETGELGDPLFTKEVDDGLEQLLADWSLFKKSGLFGTGPKGREHPLYKKISGLQVPLLLAGRFDGANQEIRQSITDYMNGWRYEQGIIYQPGETFERYLRRVIRHILDLQKKRHSA